MAVERTKFKEPKTETSEVEAKLRQEYEERFEIWKAKELAAFKEEEEKKITDEVQKLFEKWEAEQKPPSLADIRLLVDQEYAEFTIKIPTYDDEGGKKTETFVIRELPQKVERQFYRQFKDRVKTRGTEIGAFVQRNMDLPFEKQLENFLETFDSSFDVLADGVVLILNPFGKREGITHEWVENNISSNRMYSIILAQVEVNRLRDFFLRLFQGGKKAGMMMQPLSIQQLRELAH